MNKTLFKNYVMPTGEPADWDVVAEAHAHYLAREFAREYMVDWDPIHALHRLGCYDSDNECKNKAKALLKHPMVTGYVSEFMRDFGRKAEVTKESIIALLWLEANDRSWGASARSRISALKEIATLMGVTPQAGGKGGRPTADEVDENDEMGGLEIVCNVVAPQADLL